MIKYDRKPNREASLITVEHNGEKVALICQSCGSSAFYYGIDPVFEAECRDCKKHYSIQQMHEQWKARGII